MRLLRALGLDLWPDVADFLDALYPRACRLCGAATADGFACAAHGLPLAPAGPRCGRCAGALPPALPDGERCSACRIAAPGFARVIALADYRRDRAAAAWVLAFKHGARRDLAEPLAAALAARCVAVIGRGGFAGDVLAPVPLHRLRRFERGYDQADLLARALAERLDVRCVRALARVRYTPAQGSPGAVSRTANVRAAFRSRALRRRRIAGRRVWLVDDVVTSGATASECARILTRAGAREVGVLCIARAGARGTGHDVVLEPDRDFDAPPDGEA